MKKRIISIVIMGVMFLNIFLNTLTITIEAIEKNNDKTIQNTETLNDTQKVDNKKINLTKNKIDLNIKKLRLQIGEESKIGYNTIGDIKEEELEWISSNKSIVEVNNGNIIANKEGKAKVIVQSKDKKIKSECEVEVNKPNIIPHMQEFNIDNEYKFVLKSGKNYEISNNTGEYLHIRNNSNEEVNFNIVSIYEDGSIGNIYKNSSGDMWLNTGMKLRVSINGTSDIECWIKEEASEHINITEIEKPALYEFKLEKEKIYEIKNKSEEYIYIRNNYDYERVYNEISYNEEGKIQYFNKENYLYDISLNSRSSKKIEILGEKEEDIECWIPYEWKDKIEYKEVEEQLFYEFKLEKEKRYEIKNKSEEYIYIQNNHAYESLYNEIAYNEEGKIQYFNKENYLYDISLNSRSSKKIEILGEKEKDIECWIPYEWKDKIEYKEVEEPLLYEFKLEKEKIYEIKNKSEEDIYIYNNTDYENLYNETTYNKEGEIESSNKNTYGYIYLSSGYNKKIEILSKEKDIECWIPYEWKDKIECKEVEEPLLYEFKLEKGKTYEIKNISAENISIKNSSDYYNRYHEIRYNNENEIEEFYKNNYGNISINSDNSNKIEVVGEKDIECWIPYELKEKIEYKEVEEPLFYGFSLGKGKTYELENKSEENITIKNSSGYDDRFNRIIYNNENNVKSYDASVYGTIYINPNEKHKLEIRGDKDKDIECWMPYEWKNKIDCKEVEEPLFYEFSLEKGKTYELENKSEENITIKNSSGYDDRFNRIIYNNENNVKSYDASVYGTIYINSNEKHKLEIRGDKDKDIECWMPYEWKNKIDCKEVEEPLFYKFSLEKGKTYELENKSEEKITIENSSYYDDRFNRIIYNNENNVKSYDASVYGTIYINSNEKHKLEIRGDKDKDIECWMPYEWKNKIGFKEVEEPLFYKFSLEKNKTYKINNNSDINVSIKNESSYNNLYDYILYKPDSTHKYLVNRYGNINLNSSEYMIIKSNEENERETINAYLPYEYHTKGVTISEVPYDMSDILDTMPKVKLNINKQLSKLKEQEVIEVKDNLNNYNISIFNKTTNKNINQWQIKGNYIVFQNGTTSPNDTINIKLDNKKRDCKVTEFNVKLDESNNAVFDAKVQQLGYIKIDEQEEINNSITNRTLIFNSEGENIETLSTNPKQSIKSGYLESDEYTVVLLKSFGDLWRLSNLTQFDERGFIEGTDYIKYKVEVIEGIINEIKPDIIPTVDEDRISFFDKEKTIVTSNSEVVSENGLLEMRVQYKFKDRYTLQNVKNKYVVINLPSEVDLIDNSVIIDNKASKYSVSNDRTIITIPINNMNGIIKFNVKPMESKEVKISVESRFSYGNKTIEEILGSINVDINYLTINGPTKTSSKQVRVYGLAPKGKKISLYNGSEKLKDVVALSSGKWTADIELKNAYNGSTYNIVAKVDAGTENEKVSNKLTIKYTSHMPSIKKLTMYYNNGNSINLTNYMKEGKNPVITIVPKNPLTFELELDNGNENQEFYIISERNGESKSMKFTYDSKKGIWIASGFFDPNNKSYVPGTLRVTYKSIDFFNDLLYIDFESTEFKESLPDEWVNADVEVKKDTEDGFEFDVNLKDENKTKVNCKYNISKIPSDITESNITSKGYIPIGNGQYLNAEDLENIRNLTVVDFVKGTMISFAIEILNGYLETGVNGTFSNLWTLFGKDGRVGDFMQTNKDLFECFKSSNPDQRVAISTLWTLQELKFILGIVTSVKGLKPKIAWVPILWTAAKTAISGWVLNLGYSAMDQIFDKTQEKLCGRSNDLGGVTGKWLIDPSGYVYEAVDSNRVEGVTTTVYYQDENGQAVKWNAEEYDQVNPLITDKEGKYAWDVPEGLWQVKYEKEGYETAYSEWLPVPPPQTEVNIGLVSLEKPNIELFNMYEDRAEITFNKYIDISSISTDSIILSDYQGKNIPITIEAINKENSKYGKELAKKFILKTNAKNTLSLENEYTLTVKSTVKTYADVSSESDIVVKTIYKQLPTEIKVEDNYEVNYNKVISIPVSIDNISNAEEFELVATSSMSDIAKVVTEKVNFNKDGKATIKVLGQLSGEATITFNITGTDLEGKAKVNVLLPNEDDLTNTPPVIEANDIVLKVGDDFKALEYAKAYDEEDGDITENIVVIENTVNTSTAGIYKVVYEVRDDNGSVVTKEIKVTVNPKFTLINRAPKINAEDKLLTIGEKFNPLYGVTAIDYEEGDITSKIEIIENTVDISKEGEYKIVYKVSDSKGASREKEIKVKVIKSENEIADAILYQTHVQDYGWQEWKSNGQMSGTSGESKRLEGIRMKINDVLPNANIIYRTHVEDYGWQEWKSNGEMSGTDGQSKRLEGIEIKLENAPGYKVEYRVHVQDYGWQYWKSNGEMAGTSGEAKRLEGIEIRIVKEKTPDVQYRTHIQDYGWQNWMTNGQMSGTSGESKRLEGIEIKLENAPIGANIVYQTHVQDYGWQEWKRNGEMSGTNRESKRLEGIRIKLENAPGYKVEYRVHVQDYGWQEWKSDGEMAGTSGESKRLEGIEVRVVNY